MCSSDLIHSSDFSSGSYTYVADNDKELKTFSLKHDQQFRIPFIKQAMAAAGGQLTMYASPWSPPAWMKDNDDMLKGGKLKPEWAARFIAGNIPRKLRFDFHPKGEPWLEARMPAFKSRGSNLAVGLAAQLGHSPKSPVESPVDVELAKIGHQLVGRDGGFSCVSCHAVGPVLALEVFESEGLNLADAADRLLPEYYRRWFRSPSSIDPQTKMPSYFSEGQSPFPDILGGDAEKQISAVWEYFKQRGGMAAPKTGAE